MPLYSFWVAGLGCAALAGPECGLLRARDGDDGGTDDGDDDDDNDDDGAFCARC